MLYRLLAALSFLILGATQALAADCIIVGGESSYRIPDCIENSPTTAVQKFLGSNYAIITDRKDGKILAVFLAEIGKDDSDQISGNIGSISIEAPDSPIPIQPPEERRSIDFLEPISLFSADQVISDLRSSGNILKAFTIKVSQFHRSYDISDGEYVMDILKREKQNLLEFLENQQRVAAEFIPFEARSDSVRIIEEGIAALVNDDVVLESVIVSH